MIIADGFVKALRKEASEKTVGDTGSTSKNPFFSKTSPMSDAEAIQVLGIEQVNSSLLENGKLAKSSVLPLSSPRDREIAKNNFERMFAIAVKHQNLYLAGKLSAAYRLCVDDAWDVENENTDSSL